MRTARWVPSGDIVRAVTKDHRRDVYSPVSPDAAQAPDAIGPDGIRVTIRVEPAVDRLLRMRSIFFTPPVLTDPAQAYLDYRVLPKFVQEKVLRGRWAIAVEADNGEKCRVKARTRDDALTYAREIHDGVVKQGIPFLRTFAA
jgi:hypothetical protein